MPRSFSYHNDDNNILTLWNLCNIVPTSSHNLDPEQPVCKLVIEVLKLCLIDVSVDGDAIDADIFFLNFLSAFLSSSSCSAAVSSGACQLLAPLLILYGACQILAPGRTVRVFVRPQDHLAVADSHDRVLNYCWQVYKIIGKTGTDSVPFRLRVAPGKPRLPEPAFMQCLYVAPSSVRSRGTSPG